MKAWIVACFLLAVEVGAAIRVLRVSGEVKCAAVEKGPFEKLEVGKVLKAPRFFRTGTNSFVDLELDGGSLIRVTAGSLIWIEKEQLESGHTLVELDVKEGRLVCASRLNDINRSKFHIMSWASGGVAGARAKESGFDFTAEGRLRCAFGEVVIVYLGAEEPPVRIGNGQFVERSKTQENSEATVLRSDQLRKLGNEIDQLKASKASPLKRTKLF